VARQDRVIVGELSDLDVVKSALADEYDVRSEIGRGGMAVVFLAHDRSLGRDVAIKVLPIAMTFDSDFAERFEREARTSASLEHPNIVPIYRVGKSGERVSYIVMKYLRGPSLARVLAERPNGKLTPGEIRAMLTDTARALAYAAKSGVVHRDISQLLRRPRCRRARRSPPHESAKGFRADYGRSLSRSRAKD
jgi:serine/threonine protein kinase